jgi:hypothetical protein
MALEDICKFALIIKLGLFDWTVMPFGMKNTTNTFSKIMMEVFSIYLDKFLKVFVDDLNVHYITWEEHLDHQPYALLWLREVNLKLNPSKCEFANSSLTFWGHVVSCDGTQLDPKKIKNVIDFPIPTIVTNV